MRRLLIIVVFALVAMSCTADRPTLSADATAPPPTQPTASSVDPVGVDGERAEGAGDAFDQQADGSGEPAPEGDLESPPQTLPGGPDFALPPIDQDGTVRALRTPTGVVVAVLAELNPGYLVMTPCGREATLAQGEELFGAHVVLDAGHGGTEPGAVGPSGLKESRVNLVVANKTQEFLESVGVIVIPTRTADYRISILARAAIANSVRPFAFVSIHHNAEADVELDRPGSETYYQIADAESKRLAALIYEEAFEAFSAYDIAWVGDTDAGVKFRPNSEGGDYYGILRRSNGVPATLTELAFLSNPPEEQLLGGAEFQQVEADAISRALLRFLTTDDPGSGFVEAYPREAPAGSGGGTSNCEDPAFE